jgi:hypothetical protein
VTTTVAEGGSQNDYQTEFGTFVCARRCAPRHRLLLFGLYVLVVAATTYVVYRVTIFGVPFVFDLVVPGRDASLLTDATDEHPGHAVWFVAGLLSLQALFLFGGGRIPIGKERAGVWRTMLPVATAAAALTAMSITFPFTLAEMFDRANGEGSIRETAILDIDLLQFNSRMFTSVLVIWLLWFVAAMMLSGKSDQETVLRRLTTGLLAGSWVEFLVALPVDIAIRQRADSCPCATGSWLALMVAIPVMIFAFGPAMYLLYLREVELGRTEPRRAIRILLHKSRRQRSESRSCLHE